MMSARGRGGEQISGYPPLPLRCYYVKFEGNKIQKESIRQLMLYKSEWFGMKKNLYKREVLKKCEYGDG